MRLTAPFYADTVHQSRSYSDFEASPMKRNVLLATLLCVAVASTSLVRADTPVAGDQVASVQQLKTEAFKALKGGNFDRTNELIAKAASMSSDPSLTQMSMWVKEFHTQRLTFAGERHKQYEKAVGDVHKLLDHQKDTYAIDAAA